MRREYIKRGYKEVITPLIYNKNLWEMSGHWQNYKENMFSINEGDSEDDNDLPHQHSCDQHSHQHNQNMMGLKPMAIYFLFFSLLFMINFILYFIYAYFILYFYLLFIYFYIFFIFYLFLYFI